MTTYGLTATGFVIKPEAQILADMLAALKSKLGIDTDLNLAPVAYEECAANAHEIYLIWEALEAYYNGWTLSGAQGVLLENIGIISGVDRTAAIYSTVDLTFSGAAGMVVPAGYLVAVDSTVGTGEQFATDADVTLDGGGLGTVAATAVNSGPVQAPAGTLNVIVNPTYGINSVTNSLDAEPGAVQQTDTAYRAFIRSARQVRGSASCNAIEDRMMNEVPGLLSARCYENTGDVPDSEGRPAHSVHLVIGKSAALTAAEKTTIAEKLWAYKGGGIATHGSITETVADEGGVLQTVNFDEAAHVPLWAFLLVTAGEAPWTSGNVQVLTFEVDNDATSVGQEFTITINGYEYTFTSSTGAEAKATIAADLESQMQAAQWTAWGTGGAPPADDRVIVGTVTRSGAVITVTGWAPGYEHTYIAGADITANEAQAADGNEHEIAAYISEQSEAKFVIGTDVTPSLLTAWAQEIVPALELCAVNGWATDDPWAWINLGTLPLVMVGSVGVDEIAELDSTRIVVWAV